MSQTAKRYITERYVRHITVVDRKVERGTGAGVLVWMGLSLGDVAHVDRGKGGWLWDCTIKLVLAVLDD